MAFHAFSHHLVNTSPIVHTILQFQTAMELNRSALVCKVWAIIAEKMKRRRQSRAWTCLICDNPTGHEHFNGIQDKTKHFLQGLYTEPDVVFMICQTELLESSVSTCTQARSGRRSSEISKGYGDFVRSLLPASCKLVGIGAAGIVGTSRDGTQIHEIENGIGVSFLCLPKYADVEIASSIDIEEDCDNSCNTAVQQFHHSLQQPQKPACKAILIFKSDFRISSSLGFELMKAMDHSLLAGAYIDTIVPVNPEKYPLVQLTSISGERVQIASVIIPETINTAIDAEQCVKKLKKRNLPEQNSFGFIFACLGRGEGLYREPNVESSLFRKHFPRTPLLGLFGNGEIGFDFSSLECVQPAEPECKKKKTPTKLYHSYTTILVLVSIS